MTTRELVTPTTTGDWNAYHEIRRRVLFEERGQFGVYDENHPDDKAPNNYPKLLLHQGEPVGVVRVDIDNGVAILRRVAVRTDVQRRGHGRALLQLAQRFAEEAGCRKLTSFVAPLAVGFYQSFGFTIDNGQAGEPTGHKAVFMTKQLSGVAKLTGIAPQFLVDDLQRSIEYYCRHLGFELDFNYDAFYASVSRDGCAIHLKAAPKTAADRAHRKQHEHLDAHISVNDATALHDELTTRGAFITKPLEERPWSCKDFYVEDPDGYILCFSEQTA